MSKPDTRDTRDYEIAYWFSYPNAKKASTRGYPKTETGIMKKDGKVQSKGAAGAIQMINAGWCSKVQCTHRPTNTVLWTAVRVKVPGLNIYAAKVVKGERSFTVKKES